ncbi:MAG: FtsX-like permease family protein, partial [Gemmatimonadaceae bacterium]
PYAAMVRRSVGDSYLFARLVGVLAALAALLATIGLYSVVAFAVAERTHEIGIRMALGAREAAVVKLVVRQSALLTIVGLVLGTGGAVALARLLASKLFGVTPLDPTTYVVAALIWALLAMLASIVPARAAARVNPVEALRYD